MTLLPDYNIDLNVEKRVALRSGVGRQWENGPSHPWEAASPPQPFWRTIREYTPNALEVCIPAGPAILLLDMQYKGNQLSTVSKALLK